MKETLKPGVSHVLRVVVDAERTIGFMGDEGRVYGTPFMVRDMEVASRELLLAHGDAGEDSVGMEIAVKHLAPTPFGWNVEVTATVTAVEGRKVSFDLVVKDELEVVGTGTHTRFVADVAKTGERVKGKMAKRPAKAG